MPDQYCPYFDFERANPISDPYGRSAEELLSPKPRDTTMCFAQQARQIGYGAFDEQPPCDHDNHERCPHFLTEQKRPKDRPIPRRLGVPTQSILPTR